MTSSLHLNRWKGQRALGGAQKKGSRRVGVTLAVVRVDLGRHSGIETVTSEDKSQESRLLKWDGDVAAPKAKFLQE